MKLFTHLSWLIIIIVLDLLSAQHNPQFKTVFTTIQVLGVLKSLPLNSTALCLELFGCLTSQLDPFITTSSICMVNQHQKTPENVIVEFKLPQDILHNTYMFGNATNFQYGLEHVYYKVSQCNPSKYLVEKSIMVSRVGQYSTIVRLIGRLRENGKFIAFDPRLNQWGSQQFEHMRSTTCEQIYQVLQAQNPTLAKCWVDCAVIQIGSPKNDNNQVEADVNVYLDYGELSFNNLMKTGPDLEALLIKALNGTDSTKLMQLKSLFLAHYGNELPVMGEGNLVDQNKPVPWSPDLGMTTSALYKRYALLIANQLSSQLQTQGLGQCIRGIFINYFLDKKTTVACNINLEYSSGCLQQMGQPISNLADLTQQLYDQRKDTASAVYLDQIKFFAPSTQTTKGVMPLWNKQSVFTAFLCANAMAYLLKAM